MNNVAVRALAVLGFGACLCIYGINNFRSAKAVPSVSATQSETTVPPYAQRLIEAYPNFQLRYEDNHIVFKDGTRIVFDDGRQKTFVQQLDDCDIEDMFSISYNRKTSTPEYLNDCGRSRCETLFKKMYGNTAEKVRKNLVMVNWFGEKVQFTRVNGANKQLEKVAKELSQKPELKKFLKSSGSFYWRSVRGANRQSAHSYGIAFDIGVKFANYWRWTNPGADETSKIKYENRFPMEIVKVFEKHGFIWGGRWYHYDTMHFEYRPELLQTVVGADRRDAPLK